MSEQDDLDLRSLDDAELVQQMHDDLYEGLKDEILEGVDILLERGWAPYDVLTKSLVAGMRIVGIDFRDGILFVPEVLLAANAMKGGMADDVGPPAAASSIGSVSPAPARHAKRCRAAPHSSTAFPGRVSGPRNAFRRPR